MGKFLKTKKGQEQTLEEVHKKMTESDKGLYECYCKMDARLKADNPEMPEECTYIMLAFSWKNSTELSREEIEKAVEEIKLRITMYKCSK